MRNHRKTYSVLVFVLMLAAVVGAKAQTYYGSVRGLVMDKQGATLSQATVTLTNEATHIKRTAETNSAGEYVVHGSRSCDLLADRRGKRIQEA